jgi:hypothetical protein
VCVCDARTHKEKAAPLIHTAFINHKKSRSDFVICFSLGIGADQVLFSRSGERDGEEELRAVGSTRTQSH